MEALHVILAVSPIVVILICVLFLRLPAHVCGLAGLLTALIVSLTYFNTEIGIAGRTILLGVAYSLPILLFVAASILQVLFMERAGAIRRISIALKTMCGEEDMVPKVIIINIGLAAIFAGFGLNPLSILPPLLIALGFTIYASVALPAVGSTALWIFFGFGAPIAAFHFYTGGGQTYDQAGAFFINYLWPSAFIITLGVLYLAGGMKMVFRGFIPALLTTGVIYIVSIAAVKLNLVKWTGVLAGIGVVAVMLLWQLVRNRKTFDSNLLTGADVSEAKQMSLRVALFPLLLTMALLLLANFLDPLRYFVTEAASIEWRINPHSPTHLQLLRWEYFWILLATLIAIPVYRDGWRHFKEAGTLFAKRAPLPVLSVVLFMATALVMWFSGYKENHLADASSWAVPDGGRNMIDVMVVFCKSAFGEYYALSGVLAGFRMGFVSGSETIPIFILTRAHLEAAEDLLKPGGAGIFIAAASAMAATLMVMVNPARLQNAAAVIGHTGYEGRVFRSTLVIAVVVVMIMAIITLYLSHI